MREFIVLVACFLSIACSSETVVDLSGEVVHKETGKPIPNQRVGLYKLAGTLNFMKLPEQELISVAETNEFGQFTLKGAVSKDFIVELDSDCLLPYKEVFKHSGSKEYNYISIKTAEWAGACD